MRRNTCAYQLDKYALFTAIEAVRFQKILSKKKYFLWFIQREQEIRYNYGVDLYSVETFRLSSCTSEKKNKFAFQNRGFVTLGIFLSHIVGTHRNAIEVQLDVAKEVRRNKVS